MADSQVHQPGSRAITIPLHSTKTLNYINRRRTGPRNLKHLDTADSSDAGPASLSSDPESSSPYSHSLAALISKQQQASIASPPDRDPRLPSDNSSQAKDKGKAKAEQKPASPTTPMSYSFFPTNSPLSNAMLSSSSYKSVNLNAHHDDPDEPPRLITYTKHSQGFTWNDELFLPSYLLGRSGRRRRKRYGYEVEEEDDDEWAEEGEQCPVTEIFVTDEEVKAMMP
jgi:hypothetical protein